MGLVSCLYSHFKSSSLSLCTHCVNPLCWLQSSSPSILHRQVVCFIQIKTIIFHACAHAASASYTFTCYYLSELSWLWNTPLQIKRREMCQTPTLSSFGAFLELLDAQFSLRSCSQVKIQLHAEASACGKITVQVRWGELAYSPQTIKALCWGDETQLCNLSGSNHQE